MPGRQPSLTPAATAAAILCCALAAIGCDRKKTKPAATTPPTSNVIFRDSAGRELHPADLQGITGEFDYVKSAGPAPNPQAADTLRSGRALAASGQYPEALATLQRARSWAPNWLPPAYEIAMTHVLANDPDAALTAFTDVDRLCPQGYLNTKTALDTLRREQADELTRGTFNNFLALSLMTTDPDRQRALDQLIESSPKFAPAWHHKALLASNDKEKLSAIQRGLACPPDPETLGLLLFEKALLLDRAGQATQAIETLGPLALDPQATAASRHRAKATIALLLKHLPK